jgi:hypothetical protein
MNTVQRGSLALALLAGCATGSGSKAQAMDLSAAVSGFAYEGTAQTEPLRVLVTGFNDWKELGEPPNVWRCRDNPSCRLLLGDETPQKPTKHEGPLVQRLRAAEAGPGPIEWHFATMPVTWGIATTLPDYQSYDVVVHLGLGVYDTFDQLKLEDGAFNLRKGTDAAGRDNDEPIASALRSEVIDAAASTGVSERVRGLDGQSFGSYELVVARARNENTYLCNETHFHALERLNASAEAGERLRNAYFIHVPYAKDDDFDRLADGVAGVVFALLGDA